MIFENDSTIKKIVPSHSGISALRKSDVPVNIGFKAVTTASSFYALKSLQYNYEYRPEYATDDNNATLWKAKDNSYPQELIIDLGSIRSINRVMTTFEFASYYYQYRLEYSNNGDHWKTFADRSDNRIPGSPMVDDNQVSARYLKLTLLAAEKTGLFAAVWNIKVYSSIFDIPLNIKNKTSSHGPGISGSKKLLVHLDAAQLKAGKLPDSVANVGFIGGEFKAKGEVTLQIDEGIQVFSFENGSLTLNVPVPKSLEWNGAYTVATWVKNPQIENEGECLVSWCDRAKFNLANSYNALYFNSGIYGAAGHLDGHFDMRFNKLPSRNEWHHIVLTFDGVAEKVYVDGTLDNSQNMVLASQIENAKIRIGASDIGEYFSGNLASVRMYDYALDFDQIQILLKNTTPIK